MTALEADAGCQMPDARCRWPVAGEPGALVLTGHRHPSEAGILEERHTAGVSETALLSEAALAEDWGRPEEDEAWRRLRAGAVILVQFPFSDLPQTKLCSAVVLAGVAVGTGFSAK